MWWTPIRSGRFPLWEPYTYGGYPFHADLQAQLFYPPAWIAFFLGAIRDDAIFYWLEWLIALHLVLAGIGAYLLLRRLECGRGAALFGATAFQLGCFFVSQPQHLGAVSAAAWMPFAWLGVVQLADGFNAEKIRPARNRPLDDFSCRLCLRDAGLLWFRPHTLP